MVARVSPGLLLRMYNSSLRRGVFDRAWKKQKLILLDKGKGPPITPSSFRPICLLDNAGKIFERLIRLRLRAAVAASGDLSDHQHGFREGRSTAGALREVVELVNQAWQRPHRSRDLCVLVTLDVKNAFNSARWTDIFRALEKFDVPEYLLKTIDSYLDQRLLQYETTEGTRQRTVTSGVAQGSALGPDLWNINYDGILRIQLPDETWLIGFADDIALVVKARTTGLARLRAEEAIARVSRWLRDHGLELAANKTEVVVLSRSRREREAFKLDVEGTLIEETGLVKYLGVLVDSKLTFKEHLLKASSKAATTIAALSRLMPNVNGPRASKRRLLVEVMHSILLYGAEIWADVMNIEARRKPLSRIQRTGALRVTSAYRTVSEDAVLVLAGMIPIDLLARERKRVFLRKQEEEHSADIAAEERKSTLEEWERRWESSNKGRWTRTLIPRIEPWMTRKHGEINFYLTQFLSGHGHFNEYLHRMNRKPSPFCDYCPDAVPDDAEHTFFVCRRWTTSREAAQDAIGRSLSKDNAIPTALESAEKWTAVTTFVETVLKKKKQEERERAAAQPVR